MHGVARNFFTLAIPYAVLRHGARARTCRSPTTTRRCRVATPMRWWRGWLMSAVFAFFYHPRVPAAGFFAAGDGAFLADGGQRRDADRRPVFPAGRQRGDRTGRWRSARMVFYAGILLLRLS